MLNIEILDHNEVERAAQIFHRDGFVAVRNVLNSEQLENIREGARRVIAEQLEEAPFEQANRGYARYSFNSQLHEPEWTMLIDLPVIRPFLDKIWDNDDYLCALSGGDYSHPGAKIQHLHSDVSDVLKDPLGKVSFFDLPTPVIVVNIPLIDFTELNGATRIIPCTHRTRQHPPSLENEPEWMRQSIVCAPAGTAFIRDARCWHGGTANKSDQIRPMVGTAYCASWFNYSHLQPRLPRRLYDTLSGHGKHICRLIVSDEAGGTS